MIELENLGKETTEETAKTVTRMVELSEAARLNGLIADEEHRMDGAYAQIGKRYVAQRKGKVELEFVGLMDVVTDAKRHIRDYRAQLAALKGGKTCANCSAELPEGAQFCGMCGTAADAGERVKCVSCGGLVRKEARFCTVCGKPMGRPEPVKPAEPPKPVFEPVVEEPKPVVMEPVAEEPVVVEQVVEEPKLVEQPAPEPVAEPAAPVAEPEPAEPEPPKPEGKSCPFCGANLPSYAAFCTECGKRL